MEEKVIDINRAPVLTLWGAVVAERLGYERDTALTLGKALSGLNAQKKGRLIGIFKPSEGPGGDAPKKSGLGEDFWVQLCDRPIPAKNTPAGVRAVVLDQPIDPAKVQQYLQKAFGELLEDARATMAELANSYPPEDLETWAYALYEKFRPQIARGKAGWGQKGQLKLGVVRSLARARGNDQLAVGS